MRLLFSRVRKIASQGQVAILVRRQNRAAIAISIGKEELSRIVTTPATRPGYQTFRCPHTQRLVQRDAARAKWGQSSAGFTISFLARVGSGSRVKEKSRAQPSALTTAA
jgi:hypothetical protein